MINRIALRAVAPTKMAVRPSSIGLRYMSTPVEPKEKANTIVDAMPGNNLLSKTGYLAAAAAASAYGISNGLIVLHDETILVACFTAFGALAAKFGAPLYTSWADDEIKKVRDLLNGSRAKHVNAVKERIENVNQLKDVVETTKQLFAVSKETAELEAKIFELKQQSALAAEAKSTLDSWVRFEQQQRQLEQEQLIKSVLSKVNKEIENPKFQEKVLNESVTEIEKLFAKA
ncbi:ATP synthase subunit 4, mitochondrial [[Candida] jaroonii]|uniref:ATP synthase subunit 4, mitochondrial n=1 Tax=[Candida] jaroonii TaxID=467808 RepID=A0ACA9Y7J6_9ASCO|nr:ATP synthase subunit 4, mitochondrial [[Candida] jaroonii]